MSPISHYTIYEVWCDNYNCDWNGPDDDESAYDSRLLADARKEAVQDMRKHARECIFRKLDTDPTELYP